MIIEHWRDCTVYKATRSPSFFLSIFNHQPFHLFLIFMIHFMDRYKVKYKSHFFIGQRRSVWIRFDQDHLRRCFGIELLSDVRASEQKIPRPETPCLRISGPAGSWCILYCPEEPFRQIRRFGITLHSLRP